MGYVLAVSAEDDAAWVTRFYNGGDGACDSDRSFRHGARRFRWRTDPSTISASGYHAATTTRNGVTASRRTGHNTTAGFVSADRSKRADS